MRRVLLVPGRPLWRDPLCRGGKAEVRCVQCDVQVGRLCVCERCERVR